MNTKYLLKRSLYATIQWNNESKKSPLWYV